MGNYTSGRAVITFLDEQHLILMPKPKLIVRFPVTDIILCKV